MDMPGLKPRMDAEAKRWISFLRIKCQLKEELHLKLAATSYFFSSSPFLSFPPLLLSSPRPAAAS